MDGVLIFIFLVYFVFGAIGAIVMSNKGRSGCGGCALGFLGPLGLTLALILSKDHRELERRSLKKGKMRKCPTCGELVRLRSVQCPYCGSHLPSIYR